MNLWVPQMAGNFLTSWMTPSFSIRTLLYGVSSCYVSYPSHSTSFNHPDDNSFTEWENLWAPCLHFIFWSVCNVTFKLCQEWMHLSLEAAVFSFQFMNSIFQHWNHMSMESFMQQIYRATRTLIHCFEQRFLPYNVWNHFRTVVTNPFPATTIAGCMFQMNIPPFIS
jgi:hypothetical protein